MRKYYFIAIFLLFPTFADAHEGAGRIRNLWQGFLHVLSGPDHWLVIIGGSIWMWQIWKSKKEQDKTAADDR